MLFVIHSYSTYADNDKVQTRPHAREVPPQSKCNPLEQHLYGEEDCENHVDNLEDEDELLVVLEVDVLEAEREAGGEDQQEDRPLEERVVHDVVDHLAHVVPRVHQPSVVETRGPRETGNKER